MSKPAQLPVIFKKHYFRDAREWEVTAFFPTLPHDYAGQYLTCYAHVGQHSGAAFQFFWSGKKCKPEEYADLLAELKGIYEIANFPGDDVYQLVVYQKMTSKMRDEFRGEVRRLRAL